MLESIVFPTPVIQLAIEPKTRADQEKLGAAIGKLVQEARSIGHIENAAGGAKAFVEVHLGN